MENGFVTIPVKPETKERVKALGNKESWDAVIKRLAEFYENNSD